jgi:hypothetical protein
MTRQLRGLSTLALLGLLAAAAALACDVSTLTGGAVQTSVAGTLTSVAQTASAETPTPGATPTLPPLPPRLWKPYGSGGTDAWWLEHGKASQVILLFEPGEYYDYNHVNGKALYASHFAFSGAGPANLAVSDLWMADYPGGSESVLISTDSVVEARWAPNGMGVFYIGATPETYELRYRALSGEDRLLASNVAPTWNVSPPGNYVAFTRETGYNVPGSPGLFIVPAEGGAEWQVSSADRHGAGSIDDRPIWSLDELRLALPNYGFAPPSLVVAAIDASFEAELAYAPEVAANPAIGTAPTNVLWHPDHQHLVAITNYSDAMGGSSAVFLYELAPDGRTVVAATQLATGISLIEWDVPGVSFFVLNDSGEVTLLSLP